MTISLTRASNNITISNFYEEYQLKKYNMDPPYQRRSVWSPEKKAFFIDSVLKNLPIPPVFLRQKVDDTTGKTSYEVIDGKQRLTSIIEFIGGDFSTSDESDDPFHDEELAGKFFDEIEGGSLGEYKKRFWRYPLPVEYIDTDDPIVIDKIFDRLNRNGEPLTGQELRHSNYYDAPLMKLCHKLSNNAFWKLRLNTVDKTRMEDTEFISELLLVIIENKELQATNKDIDDYYVKYANSTEINWQDIEAKFVTITEFMDSLCIMYEDYKIYGVSHIYGIWCFCKYCIDHNIQPDAVKDKLYSFFSKLRSKDFTDPNVNKYKNSMSFRTKYQGQRTKRKEALLNFCGF